MDEAAISHYITDTFAGVETFTAPSGTFFFYDPEHKFPFATLVTSDEYDNFSNLSRPAVYRLNIGVSKETFRSLFGPAPAAAGAGEGGEPAYDFTALDQVMPHPVYGRQYWVCVLNPSATTFASVVRPLLVEAYERDVGKYERRKARGPRAAE